MFSRDPMIRNPNPFQKGTSLLQNRPQTPTPFGVSSSNVGGHLNRSLYNKQSGSNYPRPNTNNNMSRSRMSINSSVSQLAQLNNDQPDIFPQDLIFLLSNQEKNINSFKEKIQKQKSRVENDFSVFRTEIQHILEDVKISVQAELDLVYKTFITKYAQLKGEVQQVRLMRKQILMSNQNASNGNPFNNMNITSNKDLIHQIERDAEYLRNYRIYGYLSEIQKQKLEPILELSNEIILIGSADIPFYKNKEMNIKLKEVKQNFHSFIGDVFTAMNEYVITPAYIIEREKEEQQNARAVLKDLQGQGDRGMKPFDPHFPTNIPKFDEESYKSQTSNLKKQQFVQNIANKPAPVQPKKISWVGSNQQTVLTKWCDDVKLNKLQLIKTDHSDSILCIYFINDKYVATGSKDKTINVYTFEGKKIATLKGHDASICCLSSIRNLNGDVVLASGSDHGCCSLILWDTRSWTITSRIQSHIAAVTAIVDLEDGRHLLTGSYDKKINLFNHVKGQIILSLNNNRSSVTGMVMTIDKSRLVCSCLDSSLTVWTIIRKNNIVEEIQSQRTISTGSLVCQIQSSLLRPQIVVCATRDGTLKLINLKTAETVASYTVNSNSLIELVLIQRQMKPQAPITLTCSSKDTSLVMTRMETGVSSMVKVSGNLAVQFGCGIGPKVVVSEARDGMMAILSQNAGNREFSLYEIGFK